MIFLYLFSDPSDEKSYFIIGKDMDCPDGSTLLGQYVAVLYDGKPYPGVVLDYDEQDIQVSCMHQIGRPKNISEHRYFWPKPIEDICWYPLYNLVAVIPEPFSANGRHFQIDSSLWERLLTYLKH